MVLKPSDYSVPKPGETIDPTSPMDFGTRVVGMVVALTAIAFAWRYATRRAAPWLDSTLGGLSGGIASYSGSNGGDSILG